jgi:hypothetical protein
MRIETLDGRMIGSASDIYFGDPIPMATASLIQLLSAAEHMSGIVCTCTS